MMRRKLAGLAVCAVGILMLSVGAAGADDRLLLEMKARLDKLEKQNEDLRKQLQEIGGGGPYRPDKSIDDDKKKEQDKVEKLIDNYLKEKDKKKKEEETKKETEGYEVGKQLDFKGKWQNNQLWFETEDKAFRLHVGGRTQIDAVAVHAPQKMLVPTKEQGIGEFDNAVNFRRARLQVEGTLWDTLDFNAEYDFSNTARIVPAGSKISPEGQIAGTEGTSADRNATINTPVPTDLWVQYHSVPFLGNIRIGNQKEWVSMEHINSSRYLDFMERSLAFDAFVENGNNGFIPGISVWRSMLDDNLLVAAGIYWPNFRDVFGWDVGDGESLVSARIAGTPIYEDKGRYMVHLGLGYMHSTRDDGIIRFRARPLVRNGPAVLHNVVAQIQGDLQNYNLLVPEFMMNYGPFTLAAEYYAAWAYQAPGVAFGQVGRQSSSKDLPSGGRGTLFYSGGYIEAGYFLTGESRTYDRTLKVMTRQQLYENAFLVDGEEGALFGRGAWQILARYEFLDLNSEGVNGGVLNGTTVGVNWFLNPNAKIQVNYTLLYRDITQYKDGQVAAQGNTIRDGLIQGLGTRFAFDF
ncbi:MAG: porin [Gemmataceae bacterium]